MTDPKDVEIQSLRRGMASLESHYLTKLASAKRATSDVATRRFIGGFLFGLLWASCVHNSCDKPRQTAPESPQKTGPEQTDAVLLNQHGRSRPFPVP